MVLKQPMVEKMSGCPLNRMIGFSVFFMHAAVVAAALPEPKVVLKDMPQSGDGLMTVSVVRVPLPAGSLSQPDFLSACGVYNLKPLCSGGIVCNWGDERCVSLQVEEGHCSDPLGGIKTTLGAESLAGSCIYIAVGQGYDSGYCTNSASNVGGQRYTFCGGTSVAATLDTVEAQIAYAASMDNELLSDLVEAQKKVESTRLTLNSPWKGLESASLILDGETKAREHLAQDFLAKRTELAAEANAIELLTARLHAADEKIASSEEIIAVGKADAAKEDLRQVGAIAAFQEQEAQEQLDFQAEQASISAVAGHEVFYRYAGCGALLLLLFFLSVVASRVPRLPQEKHGLTAALLAGEAAGQEAEEAKHTKEEERFVTLGSQQPGFQ